MAVEVKIPPLGESITDVQVGEWLKKEGDWVDRDEIVVEIETDKTALEIPAPVAGKVSKLLKKAGEKVTVGDVIAYLEPAPRPAGAASSDGQRQSKDKAPTNAAPAAKPSPSAPASANQPAPTATAKGDERVMPAAARELAQRGLTPDDVPATGPGGRLLKEDVLRYAEQPPAPAETAAPAPALPFPVASGADEEEVIPMSPIRRRIAARLVSAQQTAALLTTFNEIDMSAVGELRKQYREAFEQKYHIKLGFMSFFVKAVVDALKLVPQVNAELRGDNIVYRNHYDIGVAVGGGKGLVVPIIRHAERLSFAQIEAAIADFATRAKDNKLAVQELEGGTFTISNGGIYGSLLSTPIVNPPQSAILGLHAIQDRPVARDNAVVIRPMMYVALTYDHRLIDGREAVTFLKRIKDVMENPARMLLEV